VKIPIANVYYLLCYAWQHTQDDEVVSVGDAGQFDGVHDLLGKVLAEGTFHLVRQGLDRGYVDHEEDLSGVRGKIDLAGTVKRSTRTRGRVACRYGELSYDVPHNRILKAALRELLRLETLAPDVRVEVGLAFRKLADVPTVALEPRLFRQLQLDRNRRLYRFLMSVCWLIWENVLVDPSNGSTSFRDFRDDDALMWKLFEDFVTEFYQREQTHYSVKGQGRIDWHGAWAPVGEHLTQLPAMWADVLLDADDRRIILDAKFHEKSLDGPYGARKLKSANLYQLLSYLRNRQKAVPEGPRHEGVLLYPVVDEPLAVEVNLEGFRIRARGIDLAQDWRLIHQDMLKVLAT
jgi:5-methylcytosine-specific restriction enzyme subunit McrC